LRDASLSASKFQDFPEERAAPRRRGPASAPAPTPARAPKKKRSVLARVFGLQRMGVLLLLGIGGLAFVGVPMNALFFQDGRHPAPLFSVRKPAPASEAQQAAEQQAATPTPTPPARPAQIDAARLEAEIVKPETAKPEAPSRPASKAAVKNDAAALKAVIMKSEPAPVAKPEKKRETAARAPASRDAIGALLGGAETSAAATPDKNVYFTQRALQRLGYVVKPDGKLSGGTRKAIENFERENGLPVKGEVSPKLLKALATRAGLAQQ
jgi:hypothetical protein